LRFAEKTLAIYGILWYHTSWLRTAGVERAFGTHNVLRTPRPESGAARLREEFRATLPPKKV
ncbi:MAG: hypothetical protein WAQ76_06080, partial [Gemmiger qucibialis]